MPPATHGPFTAAMIGLKILVSRSTARVPSLSRQPSTSVTSPVLICFGELGDLRDVRLEVGAGHEVALDAGDDGHPRFVVVPEVCFHAPARSRKWYMSSAFFASGRSIVMSTRCSSFPSGSSRSGSACPVRSPQVLGPAWKSAGRYEPDMVVRFPCRAPPAGNALGPPSTWALACRTTMTPTATTTALQQGSMSTGPTTPGRFPRVRALARRSPVTAVVFGVALFSTGPVMVAGADGVGSGVHVLAVVDRRRDRRRRPRSSTAARTVGRRSRAGDGRHSADSRSVSINSPS